LPADLNLPTKAALGIGDHQNLIRTKVRRFLRDTCGLSQRTAQNWGDIADYGMDVADVALGLIPFLGPLSKAKKAWGFKPGLIFPRKELLSSSR
jgi:hypothetical protein